VGNCGAGEHYCNEKSTWEASCENRTLAPTSASPTVSPAPSTNSTIPLLLDSIDGNITVVQEDDGNTTFFEGNETSTTNRSSTPTITPAPVSSILNTNSPSYIGSSLSTTSTPTEKPTEPFDLDEEW
jgi:hypothetical protein